MRSVRSPITCVENGSQERAAMTYPGARTISTGRRLSSRSRREVEPRNRDFTAPRPRDPTTRAAASRWSATAFTASGDVHTVRHGQRLRDPAELAHTTPHPLGGRGALLALGAGRPTRSPRGWAADSRGPWHRVPTSCDGEPGLPDASRRSRAGRGRGSRPCGRPPVPRRSRRTRRRRGVCPRSSPNRITFVVGVGGQRAARGQERTPPPPPGSLGGRLRQRSLPVAGFIANLDALWTRILKKSPICRHFRLGSQM
jgi:hypothetical protein